MFMQVSRVWEWEHLRDCFVTCLLSPFASLLLKVDGQVVALLVQNLERLDESVKEEADGVHNTLGEGQGDQ